MNRSAEDGVSGALEKLPTAPPRAEAVADALRALVQAQQMVPGDKLPSESELVEMLGVGRSSVREGIQLVESLGLVTVEQGRGTFLALSGIRAFSRVVEWAYPPTSRQKLLDDLLIARLAIEPMQAALAAQHATDQEVEQLLRMVDPDSRSSTTSLEATEAEARDFHEYIARIAHNDTLRIMSNSVRSLYQTFVEGITRPADELRRMMDPHVQLADAIARRNAPLAEAVARSHVDDFRSAFIDWMKTAPKRQNSRSAR